jgi:hypothetical protein
LEINVFHTTIVRWRQYSIFLTTAGWKCLQYILCVQFIIVLSPIFITFHVIYAFSSLRGKGCMSMTKLNNTIINYKNTIAFCCTLCVKLLKIQMCIFVFSIPQNMGIESLQTNVMMSLHFSYFITSMFTCCTYNPTILMLITLCKYSQTILSLLC